ncbi:MAG: tetratricopeptide repeat protein [Acidobacteria bacterium]|nr:tetratricopeptide repeat protein [Acidobacteriota bacterium]
MIKSLISRERSRLLTIPILLLIPLLGFAQVISHDFVLYDDNMNVTGNRQVQEGLSGAGLRWALTTTHGANWHPLTWLSHMLDCQLFGLNPGGHHLTSLLFHLANTVLLFLVLTQTTGALGRSAIVALLFAIHPLHVESVAWVAERKDVLSTFFWMLTLLAYTAYARRPSPGRYLRVAVAFVAGLMSKPMLVTLPFVLLLLDYWPLGRYSLHAAPFGRQSWTAWKLIREKIPLFVLSAISSFITIAAQRSWGAVQTLEDLSLGARLANVIVSYAKYAQKMTWPAKLAAFYPHPGHSIPLWQVGVALLLLLCATAFILRAAARVPYLAVGWFWYLGTLVPVIGFVQVGGQAMADRYSYVPLIGLFIILAWGATQLVEKRVYGRAMLRASAGVLISALAVCTWFQVGYWRDTATLFDHAIRAVPDNYLAYNNLGYLLAQEGRLDEAIAQYSEALKIRPRYVHAHNNIGAALAAKGRVDEAMEHYAAALQIRPGQTEAHVNVGIELASRGNVNEAIAQFALALRFDPNDAKAHYNLGLVLAGQGRSEEAIAHYLAALRSKPDYAEAHMNLGVALAQAGRLEEAFTHYAQALQLRPGYVDAHINLGIELAGLGKMNEALQHFAEAVRLNPNSSEAHFNLGKAYLYLHNPSRALEHYQVLTQLNPTAAAELKKVMEP